MMTVREQGARLFVGIPLISESARDLKRMIERLRTPEDGLRWSAPESWHVTLQFLGQCSPQQAQCVAERLRELRAVPVPIRVKGLGIFDRSGVFFAGVELSPELALLEKQVTAATARCGFVRESRPYSPHITLARRKRGGGDLSRFKAATSERLVFPTFVAREFLLYESILGTGGSKYEVRARFALVNN